MNFDFKSAQTDTPEATTDIVRIFTPAHFLGQSLGKRKRKWNIAFVRSWKPDEKLLDAQAAFAHIFDRHQNMFLKAWCLLESHGKTYRTCRYDFECRDHPESLWSWWTLLCLIDVYVWTLVATCSSISSIQQRRDVRWDGCNLFGSACQERIATIAFALRLHDADNFIPQHKGLG